MNTDTLYHQQRKYAGLVLKLGINLQKGDYVLISALTVHREFACVLAEEAYREGAFFVNILYQDEKIQKAQLLYGEEKSLEFVSESMKQAYDEVLQYNGVFISIADREEVMGFEGVSAARSGKVFLSRAKKLNFFQKAVQQNKIRWTVISAATPGRAKTIFPKLDSEKALHTLWQVIFSICKIDTENPFAEWQKHLVTLNKRKKRLNSMKIHFLSYSGPDIELIAGLHEKALWLGGASKSASGLPFFPNLPTEEIFTAPDYRTLDGHFTATRPVTYKNLYIEELLVRFSKGEIIALEGSNGADDLHEIVFASESNSRAGELALVDSTSSISKSGIVFHDLLYDENAESHLALGAAYQECLPESIDWDKKTKDNAGFNMSEIHIDIMIGSSELDVNARTSDNKTIKIIEKGIFCI